MNFVILALISWTCLYVYSYRPVIQLQLCFKQLFLPFIVKNITIEGSGGPVALVFHKDLFKIHCIKVNMQSLISLSPSFYFYWPSGRSQIRKLSKKREKNPSLNSFTLFSCLWKGLGIFLFACFVSKNAQERYLWI